MLDLQTYSTNFHPHPVPPILAKLLEFGNRTDDWFSTGFELCEDDKYGIKTYSEDPDFVGSFYPLGKANGSGSIYAIWSRKGDLSAAPVVAFGDEGGMQVVAENLAAWLQILTGDIEPLIDDDEVTYSAYEYEQTRGNEAFRAWVETEWKLKPLRTEDEIRAVVAQAQKAHGQELKEWLTDYVSD